MQAPEAAKRSAGTPLWLKVAIGCGAIAALGAVILFVAFGAGMYWLISPGAQVPTAVVIGPESTGVMRCDDLAADPGARALVVNLFESLQKAGDRQAEMPAFLRSMQEWNRAQTGHQLMQYMPSEVTMSLEPDLEAGYQAVTAVNFRAYV